MTYYIGKVTVDVVVEADHPGDAFTQLEEQAELVTSALDADGFEYLYVQVGGDVDEYN